MQTSTITKQRKTNTPTMMNKTIDYSKPVNKREINGVIVYENEEGKMKEFCL